MRLKITETSEKKKRRASFCQRPLAVGSRSAAVGRGPRIDEAEREKQITITRDNIDGQSKGEAWPTERRREGRRSAGHEMSMSLSLVTRP